MKKIYLYLFSAFLISNFALAQAPAWLNGKYPEDLHKYTLLVEKMDTVGMLCKDKKGKAIYCSKLEKDNDKNLNIFLDKQQQAFDDYVHKYKIVSLNKIQNDTTYADVDKYRYVLRKVLKYRSRTDKKHTEWFFYFEDRKTKTNFDFINVYSGGRLYTLKRIVQELNDLFQFKK